LKSNNRLSNKVNAGELKAYADDMVTTANDWGEMRKIVTAFEALKDHGLIINKKKCEILVKNLPNLAEDNSLDSEDEDLDDNGLPQKVKVKKRENIVRQKNQQ
jgi:hypothetical protein